MNSSELQSLLANNTGAGIDTSSLLAPIMPILQIATVVGIIFTAVIFIYLIVHTIQKQREHAAIMRIDKNLQKLVDTYTENAKPDPVVSPVIVEDQETKEDSSAS